MKVKREEEEPVRTDEVERVRFSIAFEGVDGYIAERLGFALERFAFSEVYP